MQLTDTAERTVTLRKFGWIRHSFAESHNISGYKASPETLSDKKTVAAELAIIAALHLDVACPLDYARGWLVGRGFSHDELK